MSHHHHHHNDDKDNNNNNNKKDKKDKDGFIIIGNRDGFYAKNPFKLTTDELQEMITQGETEAAQMQALDPIIHEVREALKQGVNPFIIIEHVTSILQKAYDDTGDLKAQMNRMAFITVVIEEQSTQILGKGWYKQKFREYKKEMPYLKS